jgi:DNA invertase Pin-like site-specific DNA recombinase
MKIGYARVSTEDQTLALQLDALEDVGCERVFRDVVSGMTTDRPGLNDALAFARQADVLVVWRLDRLGRSLRYLIETINLLNDRGVGFQSLTEQIDTTTPGGKLIFHIFGALAEFERDVIRERTRAGLAAARARGKRGGRPKAKALDSPQKIAMAHRLYADKANTITEICATLGVSRATLYRYLGRALDAASDTGTGDSSPRRIRDTVEVTSP